MAKNRKTKFNIFIYILAGFIVFQTVSIGFLFVKNLKLRKEISVKKIQASPARQKVKITAKAAIVLDDWGYNKKNLLALLGIKKPVTISVLPNLPYSKTIAETAHENLIEVILHLPLEAYDKTKRPEKDTICVGMSSKEVLLRLEKGINSVPYAGGVSNHTGSKATENYELMKIILNSLKKKNLFFLDSLVTNNSVCEKAARDTGVRFAKRSVFLDNQNNLQYITNQLRQVIAEAKLNKTAVGIGHDRPLTIKVINQMLREFQREGVELIYLSEVVR